MTEQPPEEYGDVPSDMPSGFTLMPDIGGPGITSSVSYYPLSPEATAQPHKKPPRSAFRSKPASKEGKRLSGIVRRKK